jgi:HPt (histidine-containing phosphotransfer) domain-containing protein
MSDPQILDGKAMERLREWGGDELASQMVKLFLANSPSRMDQIRSGLAGQDATETERGAHSLKSSAANVGAERVRQLSLGIEGAASNQDLSTAAELFSALEEAYALTRAALEEVDRANEE